jgi:hypothetical protein
MLEAFVNNTGLRSPFADFRNRHVRPFTDIRSSWRNPFAYIRNRYYRLLPDILRRRRRLADTWNSYCRLFPDILRKSRLGRNDTTAFPATIA